MITTNPLSTPAKARVNFTCLLPIRLVATPGSLLVGCDTGIRR